MTLEELRRRFREAVATATPDEYIFAEDRGEFDRLRVRRLRNRFAIANLLGVVLVVAAVHLVGVEIIGPEDVTILRQTKKVVPNAELWADGRANLLLRADDRIVTLLRQLRDAPDPPVLDEWVSRFSGAAAPLSRITREEALIQLAIRLNRFDPGSRMSVVEHLLSLGVLLNDPGVLDSVREFAELPKPIRDSIVESGKKHRDLRSSLQKERDEIDRLNNEIQHSVIKVQRERSVLEQTWHAAAAGRQRCFAVTQQAAMCLGAMLAK
jgi:hypothetical protein